MFFSYSVHSQVVRKVISKKYTKHFLEMLKVLLEFEVLLKKLEI